MYYVKERQRDKERRGIFFQREIKISRCELADERQLIY